MDYFSTIKKVCVAVFSMAVQPKNFGRLLLEGPMTPSSDSIVVVETVQDDLVPSAVEESNLILLGDDNIYILIIC